MDSLRLLGRSLRKRGVVKTLAFVFSDLLFDVLHRTDTKSDANAHDSTYANNADFKAPGQSSNPAIVRQCIAELVTLGVDPGEAAFVDIGSGKGRVLLIAATAGFRSVEGFEIDARLCAIARSNLEANATAMKCNAWSIHHENAAQYVPSMALTVVFLYNPFGTDPMRAVLRNLAAARSGGEQNLHAQPIFVVYVNPVCRNVFDEFGLVPIRELSSEALIYKIE